MVNTPKYKIKKVEVFKMEMSKEVKEIMDRVNFTYHKSDNQTAHMFSEGHTKFDCKMTYRGVSY